MVGEGVEQSRGRCCPARVRCTMELKVAHSAGEGGGMMDSSLPLHGSLGEIGGGMHPPDLCTGQGWADHCGLGARGALASSWLGWGWAGPRLHLGQEWSGWA